VVGLAGVILLLFYASNQRIKQRNHFVQTPVGLQDTGGYFAEDGSFLADLGPDAESAYNLGVTHSGE
jgi:hypothetical protein